MRPRRGLSPDDLLAVDQDLIHCSDSDCGDGLLELQRIRITWVMDNLRKFVDNLQ